MEALDCWKCRKAIECLKVIFGIRMSTSYASNSKPFSVSKGAKAFIYDRSKNI